MNPTLINTVLGNFNYQLNFTLTDSAGVVVNLSGATLAFNAQLVNDLAVQFSGAATIVSSPAGTCQYTVQVTDFPVAGTYNCQIVATFTSTGETITFPGQGYIQVVVEANIPIS
jgi:hypothetical protein